MKQGVVRVFNESEDVRLYIRTVEIDNVPVVFTTYYAEIDPSLVWVAVDIENDLRDIVSSYVRDDFEVEWLEPLQEMV